MDGQRYNSLAILLLCVDVVTSASFYGSSYISLPVQDAKTSTSINFRFKTHQSNAMLLLVAGPIDYLLLTLDSGLMKVRINLGSGETVLSTKNDIKLDDLLWHNVDIHRNYSNLTLKIDNRHTSYVELPGRFFELNVKYGIYVAGMGNFNELSLGKQSSYRGCLESLFYNKIDIIGSISSMGGKSERVTFDCNNEFEANSLDTISFLGSESFIILPGFGSSVRDGGVGGSLSFDIKTSSSNALLFYNSGSFKYQTNLFAVEIINGRVSFSINDGNGIIVLQSDVLIDDGFWHHVDIYFSSTYLEISVDNRNRNLRTNLAEQNRAIFNLSDEMYVGGLESSKHSTASQQGLQSTLFKGIESAVKGCFRNIKINYKLVGMREVIVSHHIKASSECEWQFPCLTSQTSPCIENAKCLQEGFKHFKCECELVDTQICINFTMQNRLQETSSWQDYSGGADTTGIPIDTQILKVSPLDVVEGSTAQITTSLIDVSFDYIKYGISEADILFHIKRAPMYGILKVEKKEWQEVDSKRMSSNNNGNQYEKEKRKSVNVNENSNGFTLQDLLKNKVRYIHDASRSEPESYRNDSILFDVQFSYPHHHPQSSSSSSSSFKLPFLTESKSHTFTFEIRIHPINDAPNIAIPRILRVARNRKKVITQDILYANDDDSNPEEIYYKILTISKAEDESFIENVKSMGTPIVSFTQSDVNHKLIRFVHQSSSTSIKSKSINVNNHIKVSLEIADKHGESVETTMNVEIFDLEIILENNTGLIVGHNSNTLVSAFNLSATLNDDETDLNNDIRFDIFKQGSYGKMQKLRGNGQWVNVSFFTMKQINKGKIRYVHMKEKPLYDVLQLQLGLQYSDIKSKDIIEFKVTFIPLKLVAQASRTLNIGPDASKIVVTNSELKYGTDPYPTASNQIIYTILSVPSLGSIHLASENNMTSTSLSIGSFVTQKMIDDGRLFFHINATSFSFLQDSFDFEVTTQGGMTNVEVATFHFVFDRRNSDLIKVSNEKCVVIEGEKTTITNKLLKVEIINYVGEISFNITKHPSHGTIKLLNNQLNDVLLVSPYQLTQTQIDQNRITYIHDDSESEQDSFEFICIDQQNNIIHKGIFNIEIVMKNDNPPIRVIDQVFHVVIDGEKKLTAHDLKYSDNDIDSMPSQIKYSKTYIPNGNLYLEKDPNKIIDQFTQEDLDEERLVFKHFGDEEGRAILWITDGQFYASGVLEIKASKPYIRVAQNTGLIVKSGEGTIITANNLTIESNMNIKSKSDITFKITTGPKFGSILNGDKETNRFTLQDVIEENIEYEHKVTQEIQSVLEDSFKFRIFLNGEDYLSGKVTAEDQIFNISIYPQLYFQLDIVNLANISVEEDEFALIHSNYLSVQHSSLGPENIFYLITQLPKHGILSIIQSNASSSATHHNIKSNPNQFKSNETLLLFTQKDINDGLIHFKYASEPEQFKSENRSLNDEIKFDVTNGVTTLKDLIMYVKVVSKILIISTNNMTVIEGQSIAFIPQDFVIQNSYYSSLVDEYLIVEKPKFGSVTQTRPDESKTIVKKFTPHQLRQGLIGYEHDGSETTHDWLTVVAKVANIDKESLPATIHVTIEPVNDETPHVVNNTGLELWEGTSKIISNSHLAAFDDDSIPGDVVYQISTPSNGYVTFIKNAAQQELSERNVNIEQFTQEQIDQGLIMYVHKGELAGGFRFQVSDGLNFDSPHVFAVTAKPIVISMLTNEKLHVFPGMQQSLTKDHVCATTNDANLTREFTFQIVKEPKYGRFLLELPDGSTKHILSFTQKHIDQHLVLYEQNRPINEAVVNDEIILDIESQFVRPLKGVTFTIEIALENLGNDVVKEVSGLITFEAIHVKEGKFAIIDDRIVNVSMLINKWKTRQYKGFASKLIIKFLQKCDHGVVLFDGQIINNNMKNIPISALAKKSLVYKHDDSNSFNDSIQVGIFLHNGIHIPLINHTLIIKIEPVNDEFPKLITHNPRISIIQGSKKLITNSILNTRDEDGLPENITYEVLAAPIDNAIGYFFIEPHEEPIISFNQQQINSNQIYFRHNGSVLPQQVKLRIKDGNASCSNMNVKEIVHCTESFSLTVFVHHLTLKLLNHSTIHLTQGSVKCKILPRNLGTVSNDERLIEIYYTVRKLPEHGIIMVGEQASDHFFQKDIESMFVQYVQINKTAKDYFLVDISSVSIDRGEKSIRNVNVSIVVKPLIRARKPFLVVSPGQNTIITLDYIDASELEVKTNSIPSYKVTSKLKFGRLKQIESSMKEGRLKRSTDDSSLNEFTHHDIMQNKVAYFADDGLDLTYPNEILTDIVHYELTASNVQPAIGNLVINIVNHKLMKTSQLNILTNKSLDLTDLSSISNDDIGIFRPTLDYNYLSIIITRDHLLVAFIFLTLFVFVIVMIISLKTCSSRRSTILTNKNPNPGHNLSVHRNTSPKRMDSPHGSDHMHINNRFSPRSTPSVSDIELGMIPLAPPTSPSLSTNCSMLDMRSRSGTPRAAVIDHRVKCYNNATDESHHQTNANVFPLPPPSLYYTNDSMNDGSHDGSIWGSNQVPMCKVTPMFTSFYNENCAHHHIHHHLTSQINPNQNVNQESRLLGGEGASLESMSIPMARKLQCNVEDSQSASSSAQLNAPSMTSMTHHCNSCLMSNF